MCEDGEQDAVHGVAIPEIGSWLTAEVGANTLWRRLIRVGKPTPTTEFPLWSAMGISHNVANRVFSASDWLLGGESNSLNFGIANILIPNDSQPLDRMAEVQRI